MRNLNISAKLILVLVLVGIVVSLTVALIGISISRSTINTDMRSHLESMRDIRTDQFISHMDKCCKDCSGATGARDCQDIYRIMLDYHKRMEVGPHDPYPVETAEYKELWQEGAWLRNYQLNLGYYDIFIVCKAHGHVMYSSEQEPDLGTNLAEGPYKDSMLAQCWRRVCETGEVYISDMEAYAPSDGIPAQFVGAPIIIDGEFLGVLLLQTSLEAVDAIMQNPSGMQKTGETYLVGADDLLRCDSRKQGDTKACLVQQADQPYVEEALAGHDGFEAAAKNYAGVPVMAAYRHVDLPNSDVTWAVVAEIERGEALASVARMTRYIIFSALALCVLAVIFAYFFGRSIGNPLARLTAAANGMAAGDFTVEVLKVNSGDEIGQMSAAFAVMKENTAGLISKVLNSATNLASSTEELSASAEETSKSVQQVAATIQEVARGSQETTVNVSRAQENLNQNATAIEGISTEIEEVASFANEASSQGEEGRRAADDASRIIANAARSVQETTTVVQALGDKTAQIGEFIGIITGIADQTNLLALNAAIEAARAGEAGRGFAVVAEEVRKLAEESNQAAGSITTLVRGIEEEMQSALEAMNRSDREVGEGAQTVQQASAMLQEIARGVQAVSEKVQTISAAAEEINASTSEVVDNMQGVAAVAEENAAASEEVSSATEEQTAAMEEISSNAVNLAQLAQELQELVSQFKV